MTEENIDGPVHHTKYAMAYHLRMLGYTYPQIAKVLGVEVATIQNSYIGRARRSKFRQYTACPVCAGDSLTVDTRP